MKLELHQIGKFYDLKPVSQDYCYEL